jgi:hypothetical protein
LFLVVCGFFKGRDATCICLFDIFFHFLMKSILYKSGFLFIIFRIKYIRENLLKLIFKIFIFIFFLRVSFEIFLVWN